MPDDAMGLADLVAELRALDDETMCFDAAATYALINRAADAIECISRSSPGDRVAETEPSPGLLMSMAIRYDHALGMPGFYDRQPAGIGAPGSNPGGHAQRLVGTLGTMRQLWEEVTGNGFYQPEKEADYVAMKDRIAGRSALRAESDGGEHG